jgi:hypothetical protein
MFSIIALSSPFIFAIEAWWPRTLFCYVTSIHLCIISLVENNLFNQTIFNYVSTLNYLIFNKKLGGYQVNHVAYYFG